MFSYRSFTAGADRGHAPGGHRTSGPVGLGIDADSDDADCCQSLKHVPVQLIEALAGMAEAEITTPAFQATAILRSSRSAAGIDSAARTTSRVARGNFTPGPLPRTGQEPLDSSGSYHPGLTAASPQGSSPHRWVDPTTKLDDLAPSLHAHYRHFIATTSQSAGRSTVPDTVPPCLFLDAHDRGSLPKPLKVVWSLPPQTGSEGPTLISYIHCLAQSSAYRIRNECPSRRESMR